MARTWKVYGPKKHGRKWRIRIRPPEGPDEYLSFATKAEAIEARAAALEEVEQDDAHARAAELFAQGEAALVEAELRGQGRRTVSEAMDAYELERRSVGRVKKVTIDRQIRRLHVLLDGVGDKPVVQISERIARALYHARASTVSPGTHRGDLTAVRQLWKWLVKKRWVQSNPWQQVEQIGELPSGKEQLRSVELERVRDLSLEIARKPGSWNGPRSRRLRALAVLVTLYEGLRSSELIGLQKRDIGRRKLTFRKAKRRKGQVKLATVRVPADLDELLHDRAAALPRLNSQFFDRKVAWVRHAVIAFCEKAGVTVISAQGLRGSHASTAVEAGETAEAVARQLGHDHTFVTERHYIRDDVTADATAERFAAELANDDHVVIGKNELEPSELEHDPDEIEREIARLQRLLECTKEAQNPGHKNRNFCVQNGKLASVENRARRKPQ